MARMRAGFRRSTAPFSLVSLVVGAVMLAGCTSGGGTPASSAAGEPAHGSHLRKDLGDATLSPQAEHVASAKAGGDAAATVTATASDGTTWTLSVPAHALPSATKITLTPAAATGGSTLAPKAGVEFAPDGLAFTSPATLTVTGPGAAGYLYLGDADGKHLTAAPVPADGKGFEIWHFSAGVSSDAPPVSDIPRDPDQAAADLRTDLDLLLQDARDDDKTPDLPQGAQPSCQASGPATSTLLQAVKAIVGDGEDGYDEAEAEIMAYAKHIDPDRLAGMHQVADQIRQAWATADSARAERIIKAYDDQPEHAPQQLLLMRAVVTYLPSAADSKVPAAMQAWSDNVAFALTERVHDDHDYEVIPLVLQLAKPASGDSSSGVKDSVAEALHKALRFKASFDMGVVAPAGKYSANLTGEAQAKSGVSTTAMSGTGHGVYKSGEYAGGKGVIVPGQTWTTDITVNLHPCDHTAELRADAYGTPERVKVAGYTVTSPFSGLDKSVKDALLYLDHGTFFLGDLTNKQAQTVTHKTENGGGAQSTFTLTLTHDPEPWTAPPPESIP